MNPSAAAVRAPRLMLIVTAADVAARRSAIAGALAAGVDTVQLRDRRAGGGALLAAALDLRVLTRARDASLLVNDRVDVARAAEADGVHLPAASFPIGVARRLLGPERWIGRSTHAAAEAEQAMADGADYVVLGPIFPTPSKEAYGAALGGAVITAVRGRAPSPLPAGPGRAPRRDIHRGRPTRCRRDRAGPVPARDSGRACAG